MSFGLFMRGAQGATAALQQFNDKAAATAAEAPAISAKIQAILDLMTRSGNAVEAFVAAQLKAYVAIRKRLGEAGVSGTDRVNLEYELAKIRTQVRGHGGAVGMGIDFLELDKYLRGGVAGKPARRPRGRVGNAAPSSTSSSTGVLRWRGVIT